MKKPTRKPLSKKLRFDIFKRDSFICHYCGQHPPKCTLEVDHITPVKEGGDNSEENLIASCFDCNRGKGASLLSDIPDSLKDKALQVKELEDQLRAYSDVFREKRERIDRESWEVLGDLELVDDDGRAKKQYLISVKDFIERLGLEGVLDSVDSTNKKIIYSDNGRFRYFCAVCWGKIKGDDNE